MGGNGVDAVRAEDFDHFAEVLLVVWVEGFGEALLPVDGLSGRTELFLPALEVEADVGEAFAMVDLGVGQVGEVSGGAGVGVVGGAGGESGPDRVLFDVAEGGAVMGGAERPSAVVMFPQVAIGFAEKQDFAGMLRLEVAHEIGDAAFPGRLEDEMDVIGHQAEGMDADAVAARETVEAVEIGEELGLGLEDALALVATLIDVIGTAAFEVT